MNTVVSLSQISSLSLVVTLLVIVACLAVSYLAGAKQFAHVGARRVVNHRLPGVLLLGGAATVILEAISRMVDNRTSEPALSGLNTFGNVSLGLFATLFTWLALGTLAIIIGWNLGAQR